jgi:hypothetical protein
MTIQKQLSHLSFAAIMLVFAALPALAQTGSADNQTAVAVTLNSVESDQLAALRRNRVSVPAKESPLVVAPASTEKQPSFSMTQFMKSATEPAIVTDGKVLEFTSLEKPSNANSKSINFVPSRGPKFPWQ